MFIKIVKKIRNSILIILSFPSIVMSFGFTRGNIIANEKIRFSKKAKLTRQQKLQNKLNKLNGVK